MGLSIVADSIDDDHLRMVEGYHQFVDPPKCASKNQLTRSAKSQVVGRKSVP